jgi:nucleoside-diphosphate-sugar epimerase
MRVIIIGGTGHIGSWLVPRLVRAGHHVVVVSRGVRAPYRTSVEWDDVQRATLDRTALERDGTFDHYIVALRGEVVVDLTCFEPTSVRTMVEALHGRVGLFVHCGTLWVHGNPSRRPYDEREPRAPFGEYGIKKAEIERFLLACASSGFPATILHPGHITGPGWAPINPAGHLDPRVFELLQRGETLTLPDDGQATLQHVHADDVAQAFELAIAHPGTAIGESFHVAAAEPVTMRAYAESVASWFGRSAILAYMPYDQWQHTVGERDAAITRDHLLHSPHASIEKAQRVLGFVPRFTAVEAAHDAVRALFGGQMPHGASPEATA